MNETQRHPSAEEQAGLEAYLAARQRGEAPAPGEPGFPSGVAGELLALAQHTAPDPAFAARLEQRLRQSAASRTSQPRALWQTLTQPERKTAMKRVTLLALAGLLVLAILFVSLKLLGGPPIPIEVALATPPTQTPITVPATPGDETPATPTVEPAPILPEVAINFTPLPIPTQPPGLPSLAELFGPGYGGSGGGSLPAGIPLSLETALPESPGEVTAWYHLENTPLTPAEASQIATQWGLEAQLYQPLWMTQVTPDQLERSYYAIAGMQMLTMWNAELSFLDLSAAPVYGGHQYPQTGLPSQEQALEIASQYLAQCGWLGDDYQPDLSRYAYGTVSFYRWLDGLRLDYPAAQVTLNAQGQVGSALVSRASYQALGSYAVISAQQAWEMLLAGEPGERIHITTYPAQDGNPQYWGRLYPAGETAHLYGQPMIVWPVAADGAPYLMLNNLVLAGDLSAMIEHLLSVQGYVHIWGQVQEVDGVRQLLVSGWEPFDEFSGYFSGVVRRTADGDTLELEDGTQLSLPGLPADVPADIPVFAQGGLVDDTLEWFLLQVHPADEGSMPPDLSQAEAVIDHVELVYASPGQSNPTPEQALDPAYRMLQPVWLFSGRVTTPQGVELIYRAYVQAVVNP